MNFESKIEYQKDENENIARLDNVREIFKMFNDAKVTLTGEAQDIIFDATTNGYITEENMEKWLNIINQSEKKEEYE